MEKPGRPANTTHPRTTTAVPAQINERATAHRWIEAKPRCATTYPHQSVAASDRGRLTARLEDRDGRA